LGSAEEDALILALDIETIRHPDVPPSEGDEERCPAAPHHRIVAAAGVVLEPRGGWYEADRAVTFGRGSSDELAILEHLAQAFANKPRIVTWNGDGFDLRVIGAAAMEHGVQMPWLFSREVTYRYDASGHEDLCDTLSQYGAARRAKQDAYAQRVGLPGKMGVDGSQVKGLVDEGRWEELRAYNLQDSGQLAGIFIRREFVAGRLSVEGYRQSASSLVALFERTEALRPIVEHPRFDRKRFLLEA
jgi:predicted PolB exonuclease-like 3'-5' exonuclease